MLGEVEPQERINKLGLAGFFADAGESDEGLDGGLGILLGERAGGPMVGGLTLDGGAGGEAHVAVGRSEVGPSDRDGRRAGAFVIGDRRIGRRLR